MNRKFILASLDIILYIISSILLDIGFYFLYHFNLYFGIIVLSQILLLIIAIISYFSKSNIRYNIGVFLIFFVNIINIFYIVQYNKEYDLFKNVYSQKYEYKDYHMYVLKSTKYDDIKEISGKNIGIMSDNFSNCCESLKEYDINCKEFHTFNDLISSIEQGDIQAIYVYNELKEFKIISSDYRDIYNNTVKYKK